jgi:hypothetical protein
MCPSTWGMIAADPRDFKVATYSLLSSIGTACATWIFTGVGGGPLACGARQARLGNKPRKTAARLTDGKDMTKERLP